MKFLTTLLAILPLNAYALIGGQEDRNPEGFRKHVVTVRANSGSGFCSGVALNKKLILTAAHCFRAGGGYYVGYLNPAFLTQRVNIANISMHPEWNPAAKLSKNLLNDIALVHLASDLPSNIIPVNLPLTPPKRQDPVNLVGFGLTVATNPDSALMLHNLGMFVEEVNVPRLEINFSPYSGLPKVAGNGSCRGDSGGPALRSSVLSKPYNPALDVDKVQKSLSPNPDMTDLVKAQLTKNNAQISSGYEVIGVSSWASGPKEKGSCGIRSVYTDVYPHKDWILKKAAEWKINF